MSPSATQGRGGIPRYLRAASWVVLYLTLAAFPLLVLLAGPVRTGGGYAWDFAMGLGFAGLALMGLQFALTARFRRPTWPFGIDIIYYFHRWAAVGALVLLLAHYAILRLRYADALGPAAPHRAPWPMTAGRLALVLFVVIAVSSLWRRKLRLDYDTWRWSHGVLAVIAIVGAVGHIAGIGHYTRQTWSGGVWIAYSLLWVAVLAYVRVFRPVQLLRHAYRVVGVHRERGRAWTLALAPQAGTRLGFLPGQFAWLSLGASPVRAREHPFSFSGSALAAATLHFTIKELGDFTSHIGETRLGTVAYVDGPHGAFTPDFFPRAPGLVCIAGGIGIAPIMSILRTLADRGDERPLHLVYGSWRWDDVTFREEIDRLRFRLRLEVTHVIQEPPPAWTGDVGYITEAVLRRVLPEPTRSFEYFLCGPKAMTDFVLPHLRRMGVPLHRIHFEHFEMA